MLIVDCKVCGKEIKTYPSWLKLGKSQYCSRECQLPITSKILNQNGQKTRFVKGQEAWNKKGFWLTASRKNGKQYRMIFSPNHPFTTKGYVREHRLVMEKCLGRYLSRDEVVHHIDGDTLNNEIINLKLTNGKEHRRMHLKDTVHKRWYERISPRWNSQST